METQLNKFAFQSIPFINYYDNISSDIDQINHFSVGKCNAIKLMVIAIHLVESTCISHSLYSRVQN